MTTWIREYLAWLEARFYSRSSLGKARVALKYLVWFLKERYHVTQWQAVSETHLMAFATWATMEHRTRKGRPMALYSLAYWFSGIRLFFAFLEAQGYLLHSPAHRLVSPKIGVSLPKILSEEAMARLIETPDITTPVGLKDRALMELLYATGLRRSEVIRLDLSDLDLSAQQLFVREGKGKKDRLIPLTNQACHWLMRYLTEARPQLTLDDRPPSSALFIGPRGARLTRNHLHKQIAFHAQRAGVAATPHTFRHTCATHLIRRGASIRMVQRLLGHASLLVTQRYTQLDVSDVKQAIEKAQLVRNLLIRKDEGGTLCI